MVRVARSAAAAVVGLWMLAGCAPVVGSAAETWSSYPTGTIVDYQLGGGYEPPPGVGGVVRDSSDVVATGLYNICYVNGFQTQPGEGTGWLTERRDLVLSSEDGRPLIDPNWPDEFILDASTAQKRARIVDAVAPAIERCAESGFNAVEIDNLDSYTRSGGVLSLDDAVALATEYADLAHSLGLAIAQKNTSELTSGQVEQVGFDFAVAEECHQFDECGAFVALYGAAVIDIEYAGSDDQGVAFAEACADPDSPTSTILRDRELRTPDDPTYVFDRC